MQPGGLTHDEAMDLAPSFVLDALEPDEMDAIREHLATCIESHAEFAELAGVLPALAASVPLVEPPASLKARVMAAAAADLATRRTASAATTGELPVADAAAIEAPAARPAPAAEVIRPIQRRPASLRAWALGIAAVLAIVALGGWNLSLQRQLDDARAYDQQIATVLDAAQRPGSLTAVMRSPAGQGPNGLAAVTSDGVALLAIRDLDPTTGNQVYEAWVIPADGVPVALGEVKLRPGGVGSLEAGGLPAQSGIVLALTLEPGPGAKAPSSAPISVGTATTG